MIWQNLLLVYLITVVLPVVFWIWYFRRLDRKEPESKSLIFKIFKMGAFSIFLASFLELIFEFGLGIGVDKEISMTTGNSFSTVGGFSAILMISYFVAGPIEEFVKFFILKKSVFEDLEFNQIADGALYGVVLAMGFSFVENSMYFFHIYREFPEGFLLVVSMRGVLTTLLHLVCTGWIGLYLGRVKFIPGSYSQNKLFKAVFLAGIVHGLFNLFIFVEGGFLTNSLIVFVLLVFLVQEFKKQESQFVWGYDLVFRKKK